MPDWLQTAGAEVRAARLNTNDEISLFVVIILDATPDIMSLFTFRGGIVTFLPTAGKPILVDNQLIKPRKIIGLALIDS